MAWKGFPHLGWSASILPTGLRVGPPHPGQPASTLHISQQPGCPALHMNSSLLAGSWLSALDCANS